MAREIDVKNSEFEATVLVHEINGEDIDYSIKGIYFKNTSLDTARGYTDVIEAEIKRQLTGE